MKAYKFLRPGAIGPFSGRSWGAAEWHDGVYACDLANLPLWIWEELWVVELDGELTTRRGHKIHADRGRLVRRVDGWSTAAAKELARDGARRAAGHASGPLRQAGHAAAADVFAEGRGLRAIRAITRELWDVLPAEVRRPVGMAADGAARALTADATDDPYIAAHGGAVTGYIAAMTALRVGGGSAYDAERAHQAAWFARELDLT